MQGSPPNIPTSTLLIARGRPGNTPHFPLTAKELGFPHLTSQTRSWLPFKSFQLREWKPHIDYLADCSPRYFLFFKLLNKKMFIHLNEIYSIMWSAVPIC